LFCCFVCFIALAAAVQELSLQLRQAETETG